MAFNAANEVAIVGIGRTKMSRRGDRAIGAHQRFVTLFGVGEPRAHHLLVAGDDALAVVLGDQVRHEQEALEQAAIGIEQLSRLDEILTLRRDADRRDFQILSSGQTPIEASLIGADVSNSSARRLMLAMGIQPSLTLPITVYGEPSRSLLTVPLMLETSSGFTARMSLVMSSTTATALRESTSPLSAQA